MSQLPPDSPPPQAVVDRNHRSLRTLSRAIELSQGQFSLILVRCDYAQLRSHLVQQLQTQCSVPIRVLTLPDSSKTLFTKIQTEMAAAATHGGGDSPSLLSVATADPPQALMILGLESVTAIEAVLTSTNQVREEFRKNCPFPLVLWVNERVLQLLLRLAPDFKAWAGTSIGFEMAIADLKRSLQEHADQLFADVLDSGDETFMATQRVRWQNNTLRRSELPFALQDIFRSGEPLEERFQASLDFLLGRDAHSQGELETAQDCYESSRNFWQAEGQRQKQEPNLATFVFHPSALEREACVLFHLGLCWRAYAVLQRTTYRAACRKAGEFFEQSLQIFEQENRQDLVAKFVTALEEVLQKQERWIELEAVAKNAIVLHQLYVDPIRQARDHGFLAEVALAQQHWTEAKIQAQAALRILEATDDILAESDPPDPNLELSLGVAKRFHRSWYLLLLARSEAALAGMDRAIFHLEDAVDHTFPQDDPTLYSQILQALQSFYFRQGRYLEAFQTKQNQRAIEHQYGFRAFVGALRLQPPQTGANPAIAPLALGTEGVLAQEIAVSGRQQDVKRLIERMGRNDYKLTVIHGPSGVGKSSIVSAGLVPALRERVIGDRVAMALVVDVYTDWLAVLDRNLKQAINSHSLDSHSLDRATDADAPAPAAIPEEVLLPEALLDKLRATTAQGFLPVLIFDQFEEFFFVYETLSERQFFYTFLRDCLNLPFVKILISIREDYLHYLLEFQRLTDLDIINNDILSKEIRYPLGDLSATDAKSVIKSLTNQAQFYLEDDLVDELVRDLGGDQGAVRPIELQVVGAELQAENITTLAEYRRVGPKEKLVARSLNSVVTDCGPENEPIARLVLFLLTNPNGTRPLKTRDELDADLRALQLPEAVSKLDLVLEVLSGSGLVFLVPETPDDRYQLVHDYLVSFIRQQQEPDVARLKAELDQERLQRQRAEELQRASEEKLSEALKKQLVEVRSTVFRLTVLGVALTVTAIATFLAATQAVIQKQEAEAAKRAAEARAQELKLANQRLQDAEGRAAKAETEVQSIRNLMTGTQPFLGILNPPLDASNPTASASPSPSPSSSPNPSPNSSPAVSPSPVPSDQVLTQAAAVALVQEWLQAKPRIFAPPYDRGLVARLTTGNLYADLTRSDGAIDWLAKNNSFYQYGRQDIGAVAQFAANPQSPSLDVTVTEESTLYLRNRVDRAGTALKTERYRYQFKFVEGRWKIADYAVLP
jgi:tetratricopeptide (TPR) repeat protein